MLLSLRLWPGYRHFLIHAVSCLHDMQASGEDNENEASAHEQFSNAMLTFHESASRQFTELQVAWAHFFLPGHVNLHS